MTTADLSAARFGKDTTDEVEAVLDNIYSGVQSGLNVGSPAHISELQVCVVIEYHICAHTQLFS